MSRPNGSPWTSTAHATLDVPLGIDLTADTVVVSGHGAAYRTDVAHLPTVAEPTAPPARSSQLHPLVLPLLRTPRQAIIKPDRPTLHRSVAKLLADPAVAVYALTTGPRWPDSPEMLSATGTRAVITGRAEARSLADALRSG